MYNPVAEGAHCHLCPFGKREAESTVVPPIPCASGKLRLILVGEAPGRPEEKLGRPFVGQSGKLVDTLLAENRLKREDCHLTNAALCRGDRDKDNERAAVCCAPRLLRELAALGPDIPIATLGKAAMASVLGSKKLMYGRGFVWTAAEIDTKVVKAAQRLATKEGATQRENQLKAESITWRAKLAPRTVLPTIHPAFVLRSDIWKPIIQIDFRRIARVVRGELPERLDDAGDYLVGGLEILSDLGPVVSLDIETDGVKVLECNILCIGIGEGRKRVADCAKARIIWPWRDGYSKKLSKWLRTRKAVVAHNGYQFDQIVLANHGVK